MTIITIGIDLAKNIFAVHGVNENGHTELVKPKVSLSPRSAAISSCRSSPIYPSCLIGMEACSGAHSWARLFRQHGHTVKRVAPKFVTPCRISGRGCIEDLLVHADAPDARISDYDKAIAQAAHEDERSKRLRQHPGIGPITASALLASLGNGHDFKNGRQVAAWIGLTPGQHSSGGKARLGHITKAGDSYLRSLLVMGARAVLNSLGDKQDYFRCWARRLVERKRSTNPRLVA